MKALNHFRLLALMFGIVVMVCFARGVSAQDTYVITGSGGTQFTATKDGETVGTADQAIQNVINDIRTDAAGNPCTIQFGDGTEKLNIGTAGIDFDGSGTPVWGLITLTGKITSSRNPTSSFTNAVIRLMNGVSVNSEADIENSDNINFGIAIIHNSAGTLTISGGTVSTSRSGSTAIRNNSTGVVNISGGTISSVIFNSGDGSVNVSSGMIAGGIENSDDGYGSINVSGGMIAGYISCGNGSVNVSGGTVSSGISNRGGKITISGDALITSANTSTISLRETRLAGERLIITGGKVENTAVNNGRVISDQSGGVITISGGTISTSNNNYGIYSNGTVNISGGTISAGTGIHSSGTINISGGTVYGGSYGIQNGVTSPGPTINISGGTVSSGGSTIFHNTASGTGYINGPITISGGTVSSTGAYAIEKRTSSLLTISGDALITSASHESETRSTIFASSIVMEGGRVENTSERGGTAIRYIGARLTIRGGVVSSTKGYAIYSSVNSYNINISGNALVTSGGIRGTIYGGFINIEGGRVENTAEEGGTAIYYTGTGSSSVLTISGGVVSSTKGMAVFSNQAYGSIVLGGDPDITGSIRCVPSTLSVAVGSGNDFAPNAERRYALEFTRYRTNDIAVVDGAPFIDNFVPYIPSWQIETEDNNLVVHRDFIYVITGGGTSFTVNGGILGTGVSGSLQTVINAIRADAAANPCTIQFGNGTETLDIGAASFELNSSGTPAWGLITLTGKITSSMSASPFATLMLNSVSVNSVADISNTANSDGIRFNSTGTLNISGGRVEAIGNNGLAVYNISTGRVNISGGTVLAKNGHAVYRAGTTNASITNLTGGCLFAYGTGAGSVIYGTYNAANGNPVIVAWNQAAGNTEYTAQDNTNLLAFPSAASAVWDNRDGISGIAYSNGANTGFIALDDVTVKGGAAAVIFPTTTPITYDPTKPLSQITLTGGSGDGTFQWKDGDTIPTVNNSGYDVVFTPTGGDNSQSITKSVALTVAKANPPHTAPTGLTATFGDALSSVTLPAGWSWESTGTAGNAGARTHKATFTPADTDNYNVLTGIDVSVAVVKADPVYTLPTGLTAKIGQILANVDLPANWAWKDDFASVGGIGDQKHEAVFTPVDKENYKTVTLEITVKVENTSAVLPPDRVIPGGGVTEAIPSFESLLSFFTAGPNPAAKQFGIVNFFWQGKRAESATLTVFDAQGNVVNRVKIKDKKDGKDDNARRIIGSWDLTDRKGRVVSEGTYLVKGTIVVNGKREKVSLVLGIR